MPDKDKEPETAKEQVNSKPGNQSDLEEAFPDVGERSGNGLTAGTLRGVFFVVTDECAGE